MIQTLRTSLLVTLIATAAAWAQPARNGSHIGYVYPAGGQRGTKFEVLVGGQGLGGVSNAYVSGSGVRVKVIQHYRPLQAVIQKNREEVRQRLTDLIRQRSAEAPGERRGFGGMMRGLAKGSNKGGPTTREADPLPEHYLLRGLESKSLPELLYLRKELLNLHMRQPSPQIGETVLIEVTIDRNAAPGDREIRLLTPQGLTNPMCFEVGVLSELTEREPNNPQADIGPIMTEATTIDLPVVLNGQIGPGDVDRFRFNAKRGQQIAIRVQARHLIPYLADAVPGWFQPTVAVYDPKGHESAFADDYRFDPDPILTYRVTEDGEHQLEIRDSLYRGRDDFVYRLIVGDPAAMLRMFPLNNRSVTTAPSADLPPECNEVEPNDTPEKAQELESPRMVKGRIGRPDDVDVFQFQGRAGEPFVAEVYARRMSSPLDSLLRLTDASGKVLAWNDDREDKETGLLTHHADSYVQTKLPEDGVYYVQLSDAQQHGGEPYSYRLRLGSPRPDFALRLTPSSVNVRPGGAVAVCVYALRKDGFDGEIEVVLEDAPAGFRLDGARIPRGCERICMTLTAPREALDQPASLQLEGRARISGKSVIHAVVPAEDMMQAFIYRHLVPSQELMVANYGPRRPAPPLDLLTKTPIRLVPGGTIQARIGAARNRVPPDLKFELREPPAGVSLQNVKNGPDGLTLVLKTDAKAAKPGTVGNLIVEGFAPGGRPQGKGPNAGQRVSAGVLPAIPFEIVAP